MISVIILRETTCNNLQFSDFKNRFQTVQYLYILTCFDKWILIQVKLNKVFINSKRDEWKSSKSLFSEFILPELKGSEILNKVYDSNIIMVITNNIENLVVEIKL